MIKLAGVGEALNLSLARQMWVACIHPGLIAGVGSEGQSCGTKQLTLESVLTAGISVRIESNQRPPAGVRRLLSECTPAGPCTFYTLSHLGLTVNPTGQSGHHYLLCRSEG